MATNDVETVETVESKSTTAAATHIKALGELSQEIPKLLASAGHAINLLTSSETSSQSVAAAASTEIPSDSADAGVEARKKAFKVHVNAYFNGVKTLLSSLHEEVTALQEAGIVEEKKKDGDGMGALDIAWLNSRRRDVRVGKEEEVVNEAEKWLSEAEAKVD